MNNRFYMAQSAPTHTLFYTSVYLQHMADRVLGLFVAQSILIYTVFTVPLISR